MGRNDDLSIRYRARARLCILDSNLIQLKVGLPFRSNNFGVEDDMRCQSIFRYESLNISENS